MFQLTSEAYNRPKSHIFLFSQLSSPLKNTIKLSKQLAGDSLAWKLEIPQKDSTMIALMGDYTNARSI